jgi:hypothetical protein
MAKQKQSGFSFPDAEPNPFALSEDEYEAAAKEYNAKYEAEKEKVEKWKKTESLK